MPIETLLSLAAASGIEPPARQQRTTLSNPEPWLWDVLTGGTATASGQHVTEDSALNYAVALACMRVLTETLACLPLIVYRYLAGGGKERAGGHYAFGLLHDEPNPAMSSYTFREIMQFNLVRWGNAYAVIDWMGSGKPRAIWPMRPDLMIVSRKNGRTIYEYRDPAGERSGRYISEDVLHIRTLGDDLIGYSPIRLARESIGAGMAAARFAGKLFANGAKVSGILQVPGRMKDRAQFEKSFNEKFASAENAHKTLVIDDGSKFISTSIPPDDAQFLETRKFQRGELAGVYRVPLHMIGDLERATFSNIEHQSIEFLKYTMLPYLVNWEQELNRKLLGNGFFSEFLVDGLERGDLQSRMGAYATATQNGLMTINEARARENLNPVPGGDVARVQMQMVPLSETSRSEA